jgi:glutamine amidotransferase
MISIIDYGMGNVRSVENALDFLGYGNLVVQTPGEILASEKLILPGVGSFTEAMDNLARLGLVDAIRGAAGRGTPLLGICLGMQLLAEHGDEGGRREGLGIIGGTTKRLETGDPRLKVPHMGFNEVKYARTSDLFAGIADESHFYFAHSYVLECPAEDVTAVAVHGSPFTAAVERGQVGGTQFHPEKSQTHGLTLLRNFCERSAC